MPTLDLEVRYCRFYPGEAPLGATHKTVSLNADETVLLLVDVYHAAEKLPSKSKVRCSSMTKEPSRSRLTEIWTSGK